MFTLIYGGSCTLNQNWTYFVRYFKIINTVLKNSLSILKQIVSNSKVALKFV